MESEEPQPPPDIKLTSMDESGNMDRHISTVTYENSSTHQSQHKECINNVKGATKHNTIRFMMDGLQDLGCNVSFMSKKISCEPCVEHLAGAFDTERKEIVLCENNIPEVIEKSGKTVDEVYGKLVQEYLVYAYDSARVHFDPQNPQHVACSYIRAINLTKVEELCGYGRASPSDLREGKKMCVARYASWAMAQSLKLSEDQAGRLVNSVIDSCYNDYAPYPHIPS